MNKVVLDYPKYQRFFNSCLKEWYHQYNNGTNFYYANPPGILFTRLRSTKNVKEYYVLDDVSHWYFKQKEDNIYKLNFNLPELRKNIYSNSNNINSQISKNNNVKSILHIGYDSWYTSIISKISKESFHVAFCNAYDVAFNTFYNYSKNSDSDFNLTFNNLRLVTGNLYNLPSLLNTELFKCIVLHVSKKNCKELLTDRIIFSFHNMLINCGCIIVVARDNESNSKLKSFFPTTNGESLWINRDLILNNISNYEDPNINNIIVNIKNYFNNTNNEYNEKELINKVYINCYYKLNDPKPNKSLKKPINTK